MTQGQIPPVPPTDVDPNDGDVTDDSLLRPVTAPPDRDRMKAKVANADHGDDVTPRTAHEAAAAERGALPILPIALVAIIVIALLLWWLL